MAGDISFLKASLHPLPSLLEPTRAYWAMDQDATSHSFRCPNLECNAQYVALSKDEAPDARPRCIDCDTPFLAKHKGKFLHYQLLRFD
jgi:hypothetical protein